MWTDFAFNLFLLALASDLAGYFFVLAISNVGYIIFNFLNLNAGWIHCVDSGHIERPWKAPSWLIGLNTVLAFVNALFAGCWRESLGLFKGPRVGLCFSRFSSFRCSHSGTMCRMAASSWKGALAELGLNSSDMVAKKAGEVPYVTLAAGVAVVLLGPLVLPVASLKKTTPPRTECLGRILLPGFPELFLTSFDQIRLSSASIFAEPSAAAPQAASTRFSADRALDRSTASARYRGPMCRIGLAYCRKLVAGGGHLRLAACNC